MTSPRVQPHFLWERFGGGRAPLPLTRPSHGNVDGRRGRSDDQPAEAVDIAVPRCYKDLLARRSLHLRPREGQQMSESCVSASWKCDRIHEGASRAG